MARTGIPMNDFGRQWRETEAEVIEAVRQVGGSGWYILGQEVRSFEAALTSAVGLEHAVGCANGLDAIELALRALGLRPGEHVLTTPLSAFATSLAIVRAGGVPVFVDVDASGLVDLDAAEQAFSQDRNLRTFVPVHLYGHALDLARLDDLRRRFDLRLVEDAAQAIGARSGGRPVGSAGQAATLSFYPTKNLGALGDGGAVITREAPVAASCRVLRDYGQSGKYVHDQLGMNSRLDELHAAILTRVLLPRLSTWTTRRREVARAYDQGIVHPQVQPLPHPASSESVWHLYPVLVPRGARDDFGRHLVSEGVSSAVHYPQVIPDQRALSDVPWTAHGELARARELAACEVSLPIHPYLDDEEVARVIQAVNNWQGWAP